jgi:hypothetical protein
METKHTPGEWKIAGEDADKQTFVYALNDCGSNRFWFDIQPGWTDDKQRTSNTELSANARLIAAAPALLEALQDALTLLWPSTDEHQKALAAIAKATGGS